METCERKSAEIECGVQSHFALEGLKLNVGCGPTAVDGWVNIDRSLNIYLSRLPRIKHLLYKSGIISQGAYESEWRGRYLRRNVERGLPFKDDTAACIYSSHLLEHLSRTKAASFLEECLRVLRPKGIVRIAVPDLRTVAMWYIRVSDPKGSEYDDRAGDEFMEGLGYLKEYPWMHRVFGKGHRHLWMYDSSSLTRILKDIGFKDIGLKSFRVGSVPDLDKLETREESLFIEASKCAVRPQAGKKNGI